MTVLQGEMSSVHLGGVFNLRGDESLWQRYLVLVLVDLYTLDTPLSEKQECDKYSVKLIM